MTLHEPNSIEVLLAIYRGTFHTQYLRSRFPTTGDTVVNYLLKQGLVEMRPDPFDLLISDKGMEFVERLLNTPLEPPGAKAQWPDADITECASLRAELAKARADVLGEAFRDFMERAAMDTKVPADIYCAVDELAQVVERIARAQRGGK